MDNVLNGIMEEQNRKNENTRTDQGIIRETEQEKKRE